MAKKTDPFQLVDPAKQAMLQQTRQAVDTYFDFWEKMISSSPTGGTEFVDKVKSIAEQNLTATHEYITKLSSGERISRHYAHTDRIHAEPIECVWRSGEKS